MTLLPAPEHASGRDPLRRIRRILLATDLSPASAGAAEEALQLARVLRAELLIVSVINPAVPGTGAGLRMDQRRAERELAAQSLVARGREVGVQVTFLIWQGEPGPSIVDAGASEEVDLIIVGSRGRNRVERFVLGSVSDHVLRHATCPVLVVRG